jgi:hypothetical protein
MPAIPTRTLKPHPLPQGATWYLSQSEALAQPGIHIELKTCVAHFHGVYKDHDSLCHHTRNFLRNKPGTETYAQVEEISQDFFEFPQGLRKELGTPLGGRWFSSERGARAAALSTTKSFVINTTIRSEGDEDTVVWGLYPTGEAFAADLLKCCPVFSLEHDPDPCPRNPHRKLTMDGKRLIIVETPITHGSTKT